MQLVGKHMEHFYHDIPGWFDYASIYQRMVQLAPNTGHFVEVGSHQGCSAAFMAVEIANSGKQIRFDCIDPWTSVQFYLNSPEVFHTHMLPAVGYYNAIQASSPAAAESYADASLDFVYIDADHRYAAVSADIKAWLPKIKAGGWLAGHDYRLGHCDGVDRAVADHLPQFDVIPGELVASWIHQKLQ